MKIRTCLTPPAGGARQNLVSGKVKNYISKINKTIKILMQADLMINMASGLVAPVFAIFIIKQIENGSAQVAGAAAAIYWITKSILRIPLGHFLDKNHGEKDDFYSIILGFFIFGITHLFYLFAENALHVYLISISMGIGGALAFTPWYGFFTRNIDKFRESFEWSLNLSLVGFGIALAGFLGGFIVDKFGFSILFVISSVFSFLGIFFLLFIRQYINKNISQPESKSFKT